ncbi:hypothetical protein KC669_03295 [Candidatus Dojkabacteria bacterium]|uniref:Uncharacterized protein n=1 Tax=Candidatus Dojkabacteria bacterium TaxID=2099670 RepID=A0A955LAE8_9BACT|nr:hypothetical protein [Candidatus Dojkabacteria bacterium]
MKYTVKEKERTKDKVEYSVTVEYAEIEPFKEEFFSELSKTIKLDGFRPGKAPREKIEEKIGAKLVTEALGRLLPEVAYEIMQKNEDRPVDAPHYHLGKVSEKDGIEFEFHFVNYPDVKLGDFTKIKVEKKVEKITKKDIETVIKSIIRSSVPPQKIEELTKVTYEASNVKSKKEGKPEGKTIKDFELNDALVKELGYEEEKTLDQVEKSVEERLKTVKEEQAENEYHSKVIEEAIKLSKFEIPDMFVENEVKVYESQFNDRLTELKLDRDTYLTTQGTDIEKKKEEWKKQAIEKISVDLVLINLANEHKSVATDADIDAEIDAITDPAVKAQYTNQNAREYVRSVITKQRGMLKLLEIVEGKKAKK